MKLNIIKDLKVDELIVFASLPDMGMVGGRRTCFNIFTRKFGDRTYS